MNRRLGPARGPHVQFDTWQARALITKNCARSSRFLRSLLLFLSSTLAMSPPLLCVRNVGLGEIPPIFVSARR